MTPIWRERLEELSAIDPSQRCGRVTSLSSDYITANGPDAPLGSICLVEGDSRSGPARMIAIDHQRVVLAPLDHLDGIQLGDTVRLVSAATSGVVGDAFAGRAVNALGHPIDGGPAVRGQAPDLRRTPPLERVTSDRPIATGVSALDVFMPLVHGQRIGIFAAPGVGKTQLLTRLVGQADVDRCVICLVGERGREVEALWADVASSDALGRTVLVAATSDDTAAARCQAVDQALALASYWRDDGKHVLLLLDSATRYAMALREIGLAAGEPPTARAYTPNVFAALPRVVERCGAHKRGGAITAVMTVLSETDDLDDPICELMKSLLDGHILLSREIAARGRFPAIDVLKSLSRLADRVMSPRHKQLVMQAKAAVSSYEAVRTMIEAGVYVSGTNPATDRAIRQHGLIEAMLTQPGSLAAPLETSLAELEKIMAR